MLYYLTKILFVDVFGLTWYSRGFQAAATPSLDAIVDFHNYIFFFFVLIFVLGWGVRTGRCLKLCVIFIVLFCVVFVFFFYSYMGFIRFFRRLYTYIISRTVWFFLSLYGMVKQFFINLLFLLHTIDTYMLWLQDLILGALFKIVSKTVRFCILFPFYYLKHIIVQHIAYFIRQLMLRYCRVIYIFLVRVYDLYYFFYIYICSSRSFSDFLFRVIFFLFYSYVYILYEFYKAGQAFFTIFVRELWRLKDRLIIPLFELAGIVALVVVHLVGLIFFIILKNTPEVLYRMGLTWILTQMLYGLRFIINFLMSIILPPDDADEDEVRENLIVMIAFTYGMVIMLLYVFLVEFVFDDYLAALVKLLLALFPDVTSVIVWGLGTLAKGIRSIVDKVCDALKELIEAIKKWWRGDEKEKEAEPSLKKPEVGEVDAKKSKTEEEESPALTGGEVPQPAFAFTRVVIRACLIFFFFFVCSIGVAGLFYFCGSFDWYELLRNGLFYFCGSFDWYEVFLRNIDWGTCNYAKGVR